MSFKPAQITSLERVASRRNVMRGAAWTTAAVTVVVATPNIAAASPPITLGGSASSVSIVRIEKPKSVVWTIHLTAPQAIAAGLLSVAFTGVTSTTGLEVTSPGATWTGASTSAKTYPLAIGAGDTVTLVATFTRSDNAVGTATGTFSAAGYSGTIPVSAEYR